MTDLPQPAHSDDVSQPVNPPSQPPVMPVSYSGGNKEIGGIAIAGPELPLKGIGPEVTLPKEVVHAGVTVRPTTVPLPPQITQLGVKSVGANVPAVPTSGNSITLPLTDDQIALALKQSVASSIRWLAEWCVRRLKMVHKKIAT